jgi:hypothetical protein
LEVVDSLTSEHSDNRVSDWRQSLDMYCRTLVSSLWLPSHKVSKFGLPCAQSWFVASLQYQNQWANRSWTKTSETVSQNKVSLFISQLSQAFYYTNGKWLTEHVCEKESQKSMMHVLLMLKEGIAMSQEFVYYTFFPYKFKDPLSFYKNSI